MPRLSLLGGPAEFYPVIVIESRASELKREAMVAHDMWLSAPSLQTQHAFAYCLLAWARETRNAGAKRHAKKLLGQP